MEIVMLPMLLVTMAMLAQLMHVTPHCQAMVLAPTHQFLLVMTRMLALMTVATPRLDVPSFLSMSL
jgi:hypothetical protein